MAETVHHASVVWEADRDDLRAHTVRLAERRLDASSAPELGGDGTKANPESMLVAAASACHMLWFLDFSRRSRLRVVSYADEAEGLMDERRFVRIVLRPRIEFDRSPAPDAVADLHRRAHAACFVANSLSCPVEVEAP